MARRPRSPLGDNPIRIPDPGRLGAPVVGFASGVLLILAVFMPWYATNVGGPFSAISASGWSSTILAKAALVMGVAIAAASGAAVLDHRQMITLRDDHAGALAWAIVIAGAIAMVLVGYRLLVLPEPAEFLSRELGLYLAAVASMGAVLSGLGHLATRE